MTKENMSGMPADDVEGHFARRADAERVEGDDVEGHRFTHGRADSEMSEDDDVEGHRFTHGR